MISKSWRGSCWREEHGFLLTTWVFLPDPAAAVCAGVIWDGIHSSRRSFPRKRESTPTTAHFQRFAEWVPAFAGMTRSRQMTPIPGGACGPRAAISEGHLPRHGIGEGQLHAADQRATWRARATVPGTMFRSGAADGEGISGDGRIPVYESATAGT